MSESRRFRFPARTEWPCKGCEERKVGCHSGCEKYLAAAAENKEKVGKAIEAKKTEAIYDGYYSKTIRKAKRQLKIKR